MLERVSSLRRPAFTGANRCWPCTGINVAVLLLLTAAIAVVSVPVAITLFVLGTGAIVLRGYLIPYTPTVAPRLAGLLPWTVHGPTDREGGSIADPADLDGEAVLDALVEANVLVDDSDRVEPGEGFARRWESHIADLAGLGLDELVDATREAVPTVPGVKSVDHGTRQYVVLRDDTGSVTGESWVRSPKAVAEVAAIRAMREVDVDPEVLLAAADPLCLFLSECPVCQEEITERPAGGCCGAPQMDADGHPVLARVCPTCGTHFHVMA